MNSKIIEPFARYDQKYFLCSTSQRVSYMKHKGYPVELLFYNCLENTDKLFHEMVERGKTRWKYPFEVMQDEDLRCIGIEADERRYTALHEFTCIIEQFVRDGQLAFISSNPYYLPHRAEYQKVDGIHHWCMVVDYDKASSTLTILDEVRDYYALFTYSLDEMMNPLLFGSRKIVLFNQQDEYRFDTLKEKYVSFYRDRPEDRLILFDSTPELLQGEHGVMYADKLYSAYMLLAGSLQVTKTFFSYIRFPSEVSDKIESLIELTENIAIHIKKYEFSKKINLQYLEERLSVLKQSYQAFLTYIQSPDFIASFDTLTIPELGSVQSIV